jgi:hypothetical protein
MVKSPNSIDRHPALAVFAVFSAVMPGNVIEVAIINTAVITAIASLKEHIRAIPVVIEN